VHSGHESGFLSAAAVLLDIVCSGSFLACIVTMAATEEPDAWNLAHFFLNPSEEFFATLHPDNGIR
jgi:hypothetical protein